LPTKKVSSCDPRKEERGLEGGKNPLFINYLASEVGPYIREKSLERRD